MENNYSFKWNNFKNNLFAGIQQLRNDNEFLDITLCSDSGEESIQAHQIILAACSPLFRQLLKSQNNNRSNGVNPVLYLKGVYQDDLFSLLDFMYQGETSVATEAINSFLALAEDLEVKGLCDDNKVSSSHCIFPVSLPMYNRYTQRNYCCIEDKIKGPTVNNASNNSNTFTANRLAQQNSTSRFAKAIVGNTLKSISATAEVNQAHVRAPFNDAVINGYDNRFQQKHETSSLDLNARNSGNNISQYSNTMNSAQSEVLSSDDYGELEIDEDAEQEDEQKHNYPYQESIPNGFSEKPDNTMNMGEKPSLVNPTEEQLINCPIMQNYITKADGGKYNCKGCGQQAGSRKDLVRHIEAKHMDNSYQCNLCSNFSCKSRIALQKHQNTAHSIGPKKGKKK